jgi:hypothetical protein
MPAYRGTPGESSALDMLVKEVILSHHQSVFRWPTEGGVLVRAGLGRGRYEALAANVEVVGRSGVLVDLKDTADAVNNIVASGAVVIGGTWAYLKFIRGRTFAHRAELSVSLSFESSTISSLYLNVGVELKNTGLSKIPLNKNMKAVLVFGCDGGDVGRLSEIEWEEIKVVPILDQHDWLEAQETILDTIVFSLPPPDHKELLHAAYKVEALVGATRVAYRKATRWHSRAVVFPPLSGSSTKTLP